MLQVKKICKQYRTGNLVQKALDGVSLNLRDNEFVAILGPSGSGKTTLLNIIGGLDRYDSGDLIINGISTKKYKDRDWDSYRNHTIGFVFQNYNLIPHQTVLANVELALTISGISKSERRQRAKKALKQVGLGNQGHKKPNQMSGGQMQRVAIARALVNDPDILLADEPTGALDSETSIQVMDLLKEVAKDRLVVMVTHNPDLAKQYATRIVELKDGIICSDSDPYEIEKRSLKTPQHKNMGKASMSLLTSLSLSFNNLKTKKARTILTSFAGSIGIIGIALILSLSNGVNQYIQSIEEDTLSEYPLEIQSTGMDFTSMIDNGTASGDGKKNEGDVQVYSMLTNMFSRVGSNDLASLKKYFDSGKTDIEKYTKSIEYSYNIKPLIYTSKQDEIRKVNPDETFASLGFGSSSSSSSLMSSMMSTDIFYQMPSDTDLYQDQYEIKAGRWPKSYNECVLVLSKSGGVSDFMLYALGLQDYSQLETMISQFSANQKV
ncbi:ABC transporter ATP-binding protein, partial [Thomasclavelia sp.]|uniref:ABC transporter ATP-binding protein n=1 Tax=Thomasclavelia sp. TaxID=3025757 RepID=UPI0025CBDBA7